MARYVLENSEIRVEIDSHGAELKSLVKKSTGVEYMWCADEKYWARTSPVLFPFVGSVREGVYRTNGKDYTMGQHGFARDMEFTLIRQEKESIWFSLRSSEETQNKYPYSFVLYIGYELVGRQVRVLWKVENISTSAMYFSIGGHPAFNCPLNASEKQTDYYLKFDSTEKIEGRLLEGGLLCKKVKELEVDNGYYQITDTMFDDDALIIEGKQASEVSLCRPDKTPYLTVVFDAPLFGLWSPAKKEAPFICIEPWYGRADEVDFSGELKDRPYGNILEANQVFERSYTIRIE